MADIEEIEMSRYTKELKDDMQHLLNKYCRIMGWDVPELNETKARALILESMQDALQEIRGLQTLVEQGVKGCIVSPWDQVPHELQATVAALLIASGPGLAAGSVGQGDCSDIHVGYPSLTASSEIAIPNQGDET